MKGHESRKHAKLSASGSSKWLNCTPSSSLEEGFTEKPSEYAQEGTLAHEFGDFYLRFFNGEITEKRYQEAVGKLKTHRLYAKEMPRQVDKYVGYVLEQLTQARTSTPDAVLLVESRLDFSHVVEGGFGTGDAVIIADGTMEVVDLKYGKGVEVSAEKNSQLMLYGLGALRANELSYDIKTVKLTIVQPRLDSISSWDLSVEELVAWGEETVKPRAELAYIGAGEVSAGSHCKFCKAKPKCRAFADLNNNLPRLDFALPPVLTDEEVIEIFEKLPDLIDWAKTVTSYLYAQALEGKPVKGYKLVEGKSSRRWTDTDLVEDILKNKGLTSEEIFNIKLKSLGDIADLMTKDEFNSLLGPFIVKPPGAPVLVPETDKRPAMGTEQAKIDFSD